MNRLRRRVLKRAHLLRQRRRLKPVIEELKALAPRPPDTELVQRLATAWGNADFAASPEYLIASAHLAARTGGPIVECGSGVSTLLLGIYAPGRVISLEHHTGWLHVVTAQADHFNIDCHVCHAPIDDFGDFEWYRPTTDLPRRIVGIVCDGPRSSVRGGRYGALPVLAPALADGATILLDDTSRESEQAVISRWTQEAPVVVASVTEAGTREFTTLIYRHEAKAQPT